MQMVVMYEGPFQHLDEVGTGFSSPCIASRKISNRAGSVE